MLLSSSGYSNEINIFSGGISGVKNVPMVKKTFYTIEDIHLLEPFFFENFNDFTFLPEDSSPESNNMFSKQSEEKLDGFSVACEDKFTFLTEALPESKINFSKRSVEKLYFFEYKCFLFFVIFLHFVSKKSFLVLAIPPPKIFIFSSKQSGDEKEFAVACEGK
jgi:hypothetical protein